MKLQGCGTALVTPFCPDRSIDEPRLRDLVEWQITSGIGFLVPCGTTGETPALSRDEWLRVIDITVETAAGRVPIVAGATSNSTAEAVERAQEVACRKRDTRSRLQQIAAEVGLPHALAAVSDSSSI